MHASRVQKQQNKMNDNQNNQVVNALVAVIADAVWARLQDKLTTFQTTLLQHVETLNPGYDDNKLNEKIESIVKKTLSPQDSDREFYDRVMSVIDDVDFDDRIDTHSIVQDVLSEIDVEGTVREEINNTTFTVTVS